MGSNVGMSFHPPTVVFPVPSYLPAPFSFANEFAAARFGDRRLNSRACRIAESAVGNPECSIPKMLGNASQAEGLYRFVANESVTAEALSKAHNDQTIARAGATTCVLVVADSSTFGYGKDTRRTGLGPTTDAGLGFQLHLSLCIEESTTLPLGVLMHSTFVRPAAVAAIPPAVGETPKNYGKKRGKPRKKPIKAQDDPTNESRRWLQQALTVAKSLGAIVRIHVADREADTYVYLEGLTTAHESHVTRVNQNRRTVKGPKVFEVMSGMVVQLARTVHISRRKAPKGSEQRRAHPARDAREATLQISAGRCVLPRPAAAPATCAATIGLNMVLVQEVDVPEGQEPVVWRLYTDLPVGTPEQIARVVDIYRARWNVEEFFKALKTGCSFLEHQLESYAALCKLLALLLPVAWKLLELRSVARMTPEAPATLVLTVQQVRLLKILHDKGHPKTLLPDKPTIREAMFAIAGLAGHFKHNGDPGWITLGRGMQRLLQAQADFEAFQAYFTTVGPPVLH